jgi:uncharacterized protein YigA (DUF484 family)
MDSTSPKTEAESVADYLRANPDFLNNHPDLLRILTTPSRWEEGDTLVDLQSVMLEKAREESQELKDAANLLINTTRSNMMIQTRTNAGIIALINAANLENLIHVICYDLPMLLDVDAVSMCFEAGEQGQPELGNGDIKWLAPGAVDTVLGGNDQFTKLLEETNDDGTVFGEAAGIVQSAALVRLSPGGGIGYGLLALGARERGAFHSGQGTDLLIFIARVVDQCLTRWLTTKA